MPALTQSETQARICGDPYPQHLCAFLVPVRTLCLHTLGVRMLFSTITNKAVFKTGTFPECFVHRSFCCSGPRAEPRQGLCTVRGLSKKPSASTAIDPVNRPQGVCTPFTSPIRRLQPEPIRDQKGRGPPRKRAEICLLSYQKPYKEERGSVRFMTL